MPTPLPPVRLEVVSHDYFTDDVGVLHIVGEVRNQSEITAHQVIVSARLFDQQGQVFHTLEARTLLRLVAPGRKSPFLLMIERPANFQGYTLAVRGEATTERTLPGLTVTSVGHFRDRLNFFNVQGQISNDGPNKASFVRAVITLYDDRDRVVNVDFAYVEPRDLAPGASGSFQFSFRHYPEGERYLIQIDRD